MGEWQKHLEVAGADFFQRYRKRLLLPGVVLQIRRELPELPLLDLMIRVHAGRRIIMDGDDFRALRAIRDGRWQHSRRQDPVHADRRSDRVSRFQVVLGSLLFAGFCLVYLLAALGGTQTAWLLFGLIAVLLGVLWPLLNRVGLQDPPDSDVLRQLHQSR